MMQFKHHPWPYSELPRDEADRIIALPEHQRTRAEAQLRKDIASGDLARRKRRREMEERGLIG